MITQPLNEKKQLSIALCIFILLTSLFYLLLSLAGETAPAGQEPDQLIYMQYAKSIAEGTPYVFSPGDSPSTGSTTHLFLFILASAYWLTGSSVDGLLYASFILNALFLLGSAFWVWKISQRLYPALGTLPFFMTLISGHTLNAFFGQTDMGFFTFYALSLLTALLYGRRKTAAVLALLCPLARPEGAVFALAFLLTAAMNYILLKQNTALICTKKQTRHLLQLGLLGLTGLLLVFFINYGLTGHTLFMSVSNKGHFKSYTFPGAVIATLSDFATLIKGFFLSINSGNRDFLHVPIIAGLFGVFGMAIRPRDNKEHLFFEIWVLLAAVGTLLLIASSGWQGLSLDRYLAWLFPLWTLYIFIGIFEAGKRLSPGKAFVPFFVGLVIAYQLMASIFIASFHFSNAVDRHRERLFAERINSTLPHEARIGGIGGSGSVFYMPERTIYNISGITSPDFFAAVEAGQLIRLVDRVKHQPDHLFEYWYLATKVTETETWIKQFCGEPILSDGEQPASNPVAVYPAKWDLTLGGNFPLLVQEQAEGLLLVDAMDLGYDPDETEHDYKTNCRLRNTVFFLAYHIARLDDKDYMETGRLILGSESFTLKNITPGKPLRIVLRTSKTVIGTGSNGLHKFASKPYTLNDNLSLWLSVDGQDLPEMNINVTGEDFQEIILDIPAEFITDPEPRITVAGDHISYAYWFYQPY